MSGSAINSFHLKFCLSLSSSLLVLCTLIYKDMPWLVNKLRNLTLVLALSTGLRSPWLFSCWDIHLSVHSKTFKSDQQCNFSDRFGSDASLQHQFVGPDFIAIAALVKAEWADDIVWFLFFPCVFSIYTRFTALLFLPIYNLKKKKNP